MTGKAGRSGRKQAAVTLKKRTIMLTPELEEMISAQSKINDREFSAEARQLLKDGYALRCGDVKMSGAE